MSNSTSVLQQLEDDDSEYEYEEEQPTGAGMRFLDMEAAGESEEEEEDGEYNEDEFNDFISTMQTDKRGRRSFADIDKYMNMTEEQAEDMSTDAVMDDSVRLHLLKPDLHDPKIFEVMCRPNKEFLAVRQLTIIATNHQLRNNRLGVTAILHANRRGAIFIEAMNIKAVENLLQYAGSEYIMFTKPPVLIEDPTRVFLKLLSTSATNLTPGSYVRIKKSPYTSDLGEVVFYNSAREEAMVKVVPRIRYERGGVKGRPEQKLFDLSIAAKYSKSGHISKSVIHGIEVYHYRRHRVGVSDNMAYVICKLEDLETDGIVFSAKEIQFFSMENRQSIEFIVGDRVTAIEESFKASQLTGTVASKHERNGEIFLEVAFDSSFNLDGTYEFPVSEVLWLPITGDKVRYTEESTDLEGTLVSYSLENYTAVIATSTGNTVTKLLSEITKPAQEVESVGDFVRHSLIELSLGKVGVILRMTPYNATVLLTTNKMMDVSLEQVRLISQAYARATALDSQRSTIHRSVEVQILRGPGMGRHATVRYVYNSYLFCVDNNSRWVCVAAGDVLLNKSEEPRMLVNSVPASLSRAAKRTGVRVTDKYVIIDRGEYKGKYGYIESQHGGFVRVKLEALGRTVSVDRQAIREANWQKSIGETTTIRTAQWETDDLWNDEAMPEETMEVPGEVEEEEFDLFDDGKVYSTINEKLVDFEWVLRGAYICHRQSGEEAVILEKEGDVVLVKLPNQEQTRWQVFDIKPGSIRDDCTLYVWENDSFEVQDCLFAMERNIQLANNSSTSQDKVIRIDRNIAGIE
ncbi:hypothetical protein PCE1_002894 [Barthelona sp. PCE]